MTAGGVRAGGCLCGAVRYEVRGPLRRILICHCGQCRRWTGHVVAATRALREHVVFLEDRGLGWVRSSPGASRGFCRECGSALFWARDGGERLSIMAGSLDDASGLAVAAHVYVADKAAYETIDDGLPQCAGTLEDGVLPPEAFEDGRGG